MSDPKDFKDDLKYIFERSLRDSSSIAKFRIASRKRAKKEEGRFAKKDYDDAFKGLKNQRFRWDTIIRLILAIWASVLVTWWLIFVVRVVQGNTVFFQLSDSVMIALLGTTTLNVLGLMVIVLKGLFSHNNS